MEKQPKRIFSGADLLLPKLRTAEEWKKWAMIACDQFTSEPSYWEEAERERQGSPSTLDLFLPEAYIDTKGDAEVASIHERMKEYRASVFHVIPDSLVYVERTQNNGKVRCGIVGKIDLEQYDYKRNAKLPVRATEGTVLERIPPRVKIRRGAILELPHVMLLIDDPEKKIIEPLAAKKAELECLYDFDLMLGGGHAAGYRLSDETMELLLRQFDAIGTDRDTDTPVVFAVGDGNHSLAAAKAFYDELKQTLTPEEAAVHPARYALTEVVNLHDSALEFEPIYRVAFHCNPADLLDGLRRYACMPMGNPAVQHVQYLTSTERGTMTFTHPSHSLTVGTLQNFLDAYQEAHPSVKYDYIHGEDTVKALVIDAETVGFLFMGMEKQELFPAVESDGALPRKTFSMGEAKDKRYYIEARDIQ